MPDCPFCPTNPALEAEILARNDHAFVVRTPDPVLRSSLMVIPTRHVETPFDLTAEEWSATHELLVTAKALLDHDRPDGYSIGWNVHPVGGQTVPHAHLHVIGRFADEPMAGQGIRHALKQPENRRPVTPEGNR